MSETYSYFHEIRNTKLYDYKDKQCGVNNYIAYMLNRTQRIFEYEGLPDTIPQKFLELQLQRFGFSCIAKFKDDVYAFRGGLGGEPDPYYFPTICTVSNPALNLSKTFKIDDDCVIIQNDTLMRGLIPLHRRYATAMVENDISFDIATKNSRIAALITAPDDTSKRAAEKFLEDIADGKQGIPAANEFLDGIKVQPLTSTTQRTMTELIEYQQYLRASWYNEIGLNANYNMKRESLTTTESQMNFDALLPLIDDMLYCREQAIEKINKMFNLNISVKLSSSWEKISENFQTFGSKEPKETEQEKEVVIEEEGAKDGAENTD